MTNPARAPFTSDDRKRMDALYRKTTNSKWDVALEDGIRFIQVRNHPTHRLVVAITKKVAADCDSIVTLHNSWPAISTALERAEVVEKLADEMARLIRLSKSDHGPTYIAEVIDPILSRYAALNLPKGAENEK